MISNQILQNTIEGLKGITRIDFCIMDTDGKALASLMNTNWNISCSRTAAEKMSIWWARSQCSRSRIFW